MADRVIVNEKQGKVEQFGAPLEIYMEQTGKSLCGLLFIGGHHRFEFVRRRDFNAVGDCPENSSYEDIWRLKSLGQRSCRQVPWDDWGFRRKHITLEPRPGAGGFSQR